MTLDGTSSTQQQAPAPAWLLLGANVVPLAGAGAAFFALPLERAVAALLCSIALCVFLTSLLRIPQWMYRAFPIFVAIILAAAAVIIVAVPAASAKAGAGLGFLPVQSSPHCATYRGTGNIPGGHTLLIFDRALDAQGGELNHDYTFFGPAAEGSDGWVTPSISHGADYLEVVGVVVSEDEWDYLRSIYSPSTGQKISNGLRSAQLPPGDRIRLPSIRVDLDDMRFCGK